MKIGILTFHYGSNYGGVLQCYALQCVLSKYGHRVEVINYKPNDRIKQFFIVCRSCFKRGVFDGFRSFVLYLKYSSECRNIFSAFSEKYLNLTKQMSDTYSLSLLEFDAVVVGSDQVWNRSQHKSPVYFLNWVNGRKCKKYSYAACCGLNVIEDAYRKKIAEELIEFDRISVRSAETAGFVKELIGKSPTIVCDPTMLYDFNEFKFPRADKYILVYILGEDVSGGNITVIDAIRSKYSGLDVYALLIGDRCANLCKWADKIFYNVSPDEWVSLFYNSSFIYTDSFHGSVFAMKFQKPFIAYYNDSITGKRFKDLASTYDMANIITDAKETIQLLESEDEVRYFYNEVVGDNVTDSLQFIKLL